jgi:hypothetical protein
LTDGTFEAFETGNDGAATGSRGGEGAGAGKAFCSGESLEEESEGGGLVVIRVSELKAVGG